jgi:hypothetical protein
LRANGLASLDCTTLLKEALEMVIEDIAIQALSFNLDEDSESFIFDATGFGNKRLRNLRVDFVQLLAKAGDCGGALL